MGSLRRQNSKSRELSGLNFDGTPLRIRLLSEEAFDRGGGSSGVYKGVTISNPPRTVAVKAFSALGPFQKQLLDRELRAARRVSMSHKFILPFLGTVDIGDLRAIVSLYMRNGNLLQYFKAHPGCKKTGFLLQVAEAVNYLHSDRGLVHGDLKCANVLVSDSEEALLGDFGLSTFVQKAQAEPATATGIRDMNTARFAAPELLGLGGDLHAKTPSKTCASDVYAYGMLVLEAVTEERPWPDISDIAVVLQLQAGNHPPRPNSTGFSPSWWDICQRCWIYSPGDRPPMHEVLTVLTRTSLEPYRRLEGHRGAVWSVAYMSGRERRVVSGSSDGSIRIWDSLTGCPVINPLLGHQDAVLSVAFSPDGRQICSGSADRTIRRWDAECGAPIGKPMTGHDNTVTGVAFSPDGTRIVSCSDDRTVRLWDAATGDTNPLACYTLWVWSVAFSPDGACMASGSGDGTILLLDSATGTSLGVLGNGSAVLSVCFSPDRIHLVSGNANGKVLVWNVSTRQLERELTGHSLLVRSVAVSPCNGYIASGSSDQTIRLWDAHTGDAIGEPLAGHTDSVQSVVFSPDGRSVVSGSQDKTVRIWDLFE